MGKKKNETLLKSTWLMKDLARVTDGKRPLEFVASELSAIIEQMPAELDHVVDNATKIVVTIETV